MEISPIMMTMLLFYSFLFGIFMGAFYDTTRVVRVFFGARYGGIGAEKISSWRLPLSGKKVPFSSKGRAVSWVVIFLGDVLCFLLCGIGVVVLNYSYNYGEFRAFTVMGAMIGFLLYRCSLGRLTIMFLEPIAMMLNFVFFAIFDFFVYPFYIIGKKVIEFLQKRLFLCTFTLEKKKERVYNIREEVYLLEMSKNGFLS